MNFFMFKGLRTRSVGRDVSTFVVGVKGVVKTDHLDESRLVTESSGMCKVVGQIFGLVDSGTLLAVSVDVVVDATGNGVDFGAKVQ